MSVWDDSKIADWSPTQLAKFIQQTIFADPPPLPPSITLDSLSVIGDAEIGGQFSVAGLARLLGKTIPTLSAAVVTRLANETIPDASNELLDLGETIYKSDGIGVLTTTGRINILETGLYAVGANVTWAANTTGTRSLWVSNVVNNDVLARDTQEAQPSTGTSQSVTTLIPIEKGSRLRATVRQNSGGALDVLATTYSPILWAIRLSAI